MNTIEHTNRPAQRLVLWRGLLLMFLGLMVLAGASPAEAERTNIRNFYGVESGQIISGEIELGARVSGDNDQLHFRLVGPKELDWSVKIEVQRQGHRPSFAVDKDGAAIAWDTTQVPNGKYLLTCYAKDEAGEVISTRTIEFRVSNHGKHVKRDSNETTPAEARSAEVADTEEDAPAQAVAATEDEADEADQPAPSVALNSALNPVLNVAFDVQFGDFENTYRPGSGKALPLKVAGAPAAGVDVLVLAWSDAEQRMVNEFAFVLKSAPWEIPADRLKELPSGNVNLQLLPRVNGKIQGKLKRDMMVQAPKMSFRLAFENPPATYVRGSGKSISLKANEALPADTVVHYDALRNNGTGWTQSLKRAAMSGDGWIIPASSLDALPAGRSILRVAVRDADEIYVVKHPIQVIVPAPVTDPTPVTGTDPVVEPNPSTPINGAALFVSKPTTYTPGVSGDIAFNVDSLPEGGDVLIIAWSESKFAMVDAFAHTMKSGPWRISASKLALLPPGEVELQLIIRGGETRHKTVHRITVAGSTTSPSPGDEPADSGSGDSGNNADPVDSGDSSNGGTTGSNGDSTGGTNEEPIEVPSDPTPSPDLTPDPVADPAADLGFEVTADGFTKLKKSADTQVIYVSSSRGNDNNDGLSEAKPVKTLVKGVSLLRDGKPDWLLLKAGDVWDGENFGEVRKSGGGVDRPMVFGVYGEGKRPLIMPAHNTHGLMVRDNTLNGMVIQGLHFYAVTRDMTSPRYRDRNGSYNGINVRIGMSSGRYIRGLVIEDCVVTHFDDNILLTDDWARTQGEGVPGRMQVVVRRNIIRFAQGDDAHSVGLYVEGSYDSIIEENLLDHNGWTKAPGDNSRNTRSHNVYCQRYNGPIVFRNNISTRAGANGLQLRAGGDITGNVFARNALAFYSAINDSRANYNVIVESTDIREDVGSDWRGMGLMGWQMNRYEVIGNVVANRLGTRQVPGIEVSAKQLIVKNNVVHNWRDGNDGDVSIIASGATMSGNLIPENFGWKDPPYVDPGRNLDSYAKTIGLKGTTDAFLEAAANRPRGQWVKEYAPDAVARYIRNGFELLPHD